MIAFPKGKTYSKQ